MYAQAVEAEVFCYRDAQGLAADAIIETTDHRWAAFEVKLGHDTEKIGEPLALVVVTATGYA